jgi:hypothetical protein
MACRSLAAKIAENLHHDDGQVPVRHPASDNAMTVTVRS